VYPTKNELSEPMRAKLVELLNAGLADVVDWQSRAV